MPLPWSAAADASSRRQYFPTRPKRPALALIISTMTTEATIRSILQRHANLKVDPLAIDQATDLYQSGMTSQTGVNVMLALEAAFDFEFPDDMLNRTVFQSIANIHAAVDKLKH
jgi:acyl carrier protein